MTDRICLLPIDFVCPYGAQEIDEDGERALCNRLGTDCTFNRPLIGYTGHECERCKETDCFSRKVRK